ncbi:vanin-like protein 1 isoform X2 [Pectinophora gossypiella]|uniref:vanin-like protein 1 isoform X2 n=1 Tax=Pectinophora gossypiella TaxID=13191 RepID=UPI00214E8B2B|nr:vanin-like protein 1 isoform X2 [Pectinophora gossypiella]
MRVEVITILCLFVYTDQKSTPQDDSYVAAVVEYQVLSNETINLQNYVRHIADAAQQGADIVVFPEMTLTRGSAVPVPIYTTLKDHPVPALRPDLYNEHLVTISAAARANDIYVVINIQEELDCTKDRGEECPEQKEYKFNTNVVFNRTGAVIDRYRKINLFGEFTRTPALKPDLGIFTTDFGVTFGHFICFDLMFQVPAIQVVDKYNLTDIIFPTMWFSELPYLTAVQIQEAYAYAMNVNFLGAGANNVRVGSAGSGIYSGKAGALVSTMPGLPTTLLMVSRVPKVPGQVNFPVPGPIYDKPTDHDSLALITDPSLPSHVSQPLVEGFQEFTLVDQEVSCKFTVRLNKREGASHQYRAFVQDGSNTYSHRRRQIGVAGCVLTACTDRDAKSCGHKFDRADKTVEIEELEIEMTTYRNQYNGTLKCDNVVYFPSSMRSSKFPLSSKNFTFIDSTQNGDAKQNGGRERIVYKITAPQDDLVTFGIWGRVYTRDVNHDIETSEEDIQNYIEIENIIYDKNKELNREEW